MAVRVPEQDPALDRLPPREPALVTALALAAVLFAVLLANGRPSLAIAPTLPGLLRRLLPADETAAALAGKAAASLAASLSGAVLFLAVARRWPEAESAAAAVVFVLGTPLWAASQALWPQPLATLSLCVAVLFIGRAEHEPAWAGRAGLPLGLALSINPLDVALVAVLVVAIAARWPRRAVSLVVLGAAPVVVGLVARGFVSSPPAGPSLAARVGLAAFGPGPLALLASPGKGMLFFAPATFIAAAGLALTFLRGERWLAGAFGLAALAHGLLVGAARDALGGDAWGPRVLADAMPLLMLFLPEGLARAPALGGALATVSVAVQALGAFAYDDRWVRIEQSPPSPAHAELWDLPHSPMLLYARRRVVFLAAPGQSGSRLVLRTHPMVLFSPDGSRIQFAGEEAVVKGADATLEDVYLLGGARVEGGRLRLRSHDDGLFLRVTVGARGRALELRVAGRGAGGIEVIEGGFWNPAPRVRVYPATGSFLVRHPYRYAESGGPDLRVSLGRGAGEVQIDWVALVPPTDPVAPLQAP